MNIKQLIGDQLSNVTSKVYYQYFPATFKNGFDVGIVYTVLNSENVNSFDKKEFIKTYPLDIVIRAGSLNQIDNLIPSIKEQIYGLEGGEYIQYITLLTEESEYDDDLKVWESIIQFDLVG